MLLFPLRVCLSQSFTQCCCSCLESGSGGTRRGFCSIHAIFLPLLKIPSTVETSFGFTQLNVSVLAQTFFLSYVIVKDTVLFMWRPKAFFPHSKVPKKWWIRTLGWFICFSRSLTVFSISSTHCHSGKSCRYQQQPWLTPWLSQLLGTIFTVMQILAYCLATSGYLGLVPWLWRGKMFDIIWVNLTVVAFFVVIINTSI